MYKLLFLIVYTLWFTFSLNAQTAFFELPLYFEDAVGNRDTIVIGSDYNADSFGLSGGIFGEIDIALNTPWDDDLEVRIQEVLNYFQKISIVETTPFAGANGWGNSWDWPIIMIHAKHFPLTVSWDSSIVNSIFPSPEVLIWANDSYFTLYLPEDWDFSCYEGIPCNLFCVHNKNHVVLEESYFSLFYQPEFYNPTNNGNIKTESGDSSWLRTLYWVEYPYPDPYLDFCGVWGEPDVESSTEDYIPSPVFIKNPTHDELQLSNESSITKVQIVNAEGRRIEEYSFPSNNINVSHIKSGIYILIVEEHGKYSTHKMVKL